LEALEKARRIARASEYDLSSRDCTRQPANGFGARGREADRRAIGFGQNGWFGEKVSEAAACVERFSEGLNEAAS